jgi:hypothetical protein
MESYKLIIKNIIKTDINFFSLDYKEDKTIKWYIKLSFILLEGLTSINDKYIILYELFNGFLLKGKQHEFIDYLYKIQKTYNALNRFAYNYKCKKTKIVVNLDMGLNELNETDKNVICIIDNNSKYLFHVNDLIKIINVSLTNSVSFFAQPISVKNPYNNLPFNKSILYNIYFYIKYKTHYYSELLYKFFKCNFNLTKFKFLNENLLREYSIENYVYNSPVNVIEPDARAIVLIFNLQCERMRLKNRILINKDFPANKLVTILKPYLFLYYKSMYSFHPEIKKKYFILFKLSMLRFTKFNPQFGKKKVKIIYKLTDYFKKKICGKEITFDDKCINFYDNAMQNKTFLLDHLKWDELINDITLNNDLTFNQHYENEDDMGDEDAAEDDIGYNAMIDEDDTTIDEDDTMVDEDDTTIDEDDTTIDEDDTTIDEHEEEEEDL